MLHMRCAFTVVELLVVLGVIALVAALTLPSVQSAREASRRASCAANLQELGRALQIYESGFRAFPPAMPAMTNNSNVGNAWYAPHVRLLPFVEREAAFGCVDLAQPVLPPISKFAPPVSERSSTNDARCIVAAIFKCPSDGVSQVSGPANNYRVCTGAAPYDWRRGAFVILKPRRPADFLDGLSMTIGMSEKLVGAAAPFAFSQRRDFWYSGASAMSWTPTADEMIQVCGALGAPPPDFYSFAGFSWYYAGYEFTWYNHVAVPNTAVSDCASDPAYPPDGVRASPVSGGLFQATSSHPGGVNCLTMDGACHFFSGNVHPTVWRALATVAAGEAMDGSAF